MLSLAYIVYKVQGLLSIKLSLASIYKIKDHFGQQMYVALSRVTSLDGLYLTGTFK